MPESWKNVALLRGPGFLCTCEIDPSYPLPLRSIVRESQGEGRLIFSPEGLGNASGNAFRRVLIWALKPAARLVELSSVAVRRTKYKPNKPNKAHQWLDCGRLRAASSAFSMLM